MRIVNSLTLRPGTMLSLPVFGEKRITRIDLVEYSRLRVSLDETDPAIGFDVDTRGFNRVPEDIAEVTELPLTEFDLLTIDGVGTRGVSSIEEIRPERYQFRLAKKLEADIIVHVRTTTPSPATEWWEEECFRVSGEVECSECGHPYWKHPMVTSEAPSLVRACDGRMLKL
jgi:hypothetical protein